MILMAFGLLLVAGQLLMRTQFSWRRRYGFAAQSVARRVQWRALAYLLLVLALVTIAVAYPIDLAILVWTAFFGPVWWLTVLVDSLWRGRISGK